MIRVRVSEDALQDLNDGCLFYETQEPGLGDYFAACLRADIEGLKVSAGVHRVVYLDYHRLLSRVFPYGISTPWRRGAPWSGPWLISEGTRHGYTRS